LIRILGLTGPKGSGKDTVAQIIKSKYIDVESIAFADPIKTVMQDLFKLDRVDNSQYDQFKRTNLHYRVDGSDFVIPGRRMVREIGMLMRRYDDNQFIDYVKHTIMNLPDKIWIVTDMRFDNEYMVLKSIGAKIVKINRPTFDYDGHISERGFDDFLVDHILMNDGNLEYLNMRVDVMMNQIMKEWK